MRKTYYCFRLDAFAPLLTNAEADELASLKLDADRVQMVREAFELLSPELKRTEPPSEGEVERAFETLHARFETLTGHPRLDNPHRYWVLRASCYGRLCPACETPFRTPNAKMCVRCGYDLPPGEVAGPLTV